MIITYTGKYFDYSNINKDSIDVNDVIPAITRTNRFMGHTKRPYNVGEHTIMCHLMAKELGYSTREQLLVLVHDFTEAYCGDVNTDLKNLLPEYKRIEREVELAIYDYLGIDAPTEEEEFKIKVVDYTMLIVEMRDLTLHNHNKKIEELKKYVSFDMLRHKLFSLSPNSNTEEKSIMNYLAVTFEILMERIGNPMFVEEFE